MPCILVRYYAQRFCNVISMRKRYLGSGNMETKLKVNRDKKKQMRYMAAEILKGPNSALSYM